MKKSLLALAALSAFAGGAMAQSSVTLFGIVDLGIRNVKNDNSAGDITSITKDGNASSRLGFRGVEDLGGGLKAGFWIEGALNADDGNASGQTWQRRSTVSLMGNWGEIRLGRDYVPTFWNHTVFDPFGTNGVGDGSHVFTNASTSWTDQSKAVAGTFARANNTVAYHLPSMGGLYGQLTAALGEATTGNKYWGGRIGYGAGPINVALAYGVTDQTGTMTDDVKDWNIAGSYNFGMATVMGIYRESEYGSNKNTGYELGVTVPVGAGTFKAAYSETKYEAPGASPKSNKIAVGYVYDLSKRTAVYVHGAQIDNDAGLIRVIGGGATPTAGGGKSVGYEAGIRHSF